LQPDPHPRLLSLVLQPDSFKLESCKFNIIIIILLNQALQLDPKLFGISLQKDLKLLDLSLFDIFDAKKKK